MLNGQNFLWSLEDGLSRQRINLSRKCIICGFNFNLLVSEQFENESTDLYFLLNTLRYLRMQEENVTLKWGDVVRIHGVNISKDETTKGLIMSKGFTDPNIYYQIYEDFSSVNFYRESLFQILPKSNFDMHDQLLYQSLTDQQKETVSARADGQVEQFKSTLENKKGQEIKYESQVVFRHVESRGYLEGMMKAADSGQGAFRVQVSQNLSSFVVFKIVSHRSYENENDLVFYNDALQIYHPSSDSYINFDENKAPIYLDVKEKEVEIPADDDFFKFSKNRPAIKRPADIRTWIINENKSKCLWKFIQHCSCEAFMNKEKIKSHDIVYFEHTMRDEESLVSSLISRPLKYYLKQSKQKQSYECFWELVPKKVNEFGPEQPDAFWARNIVTGELLTFNDFKVQIQQSKQKTSKSSGAGFDNLGLINLICSQDKEGDNKLQRGDKWEINTRQQQIVRHYNSNFEKVDLKAVNKLPKDIFKIYKVEEDVIFDAEYVLTSHEPLIKFVEIITSRLVNHASPDFKFEDFFFDMMDIEPFLLGITEILKLLTGKIYQTQYENIASSGNTPFKHVQKILVETGITDILIEIISLLYEPFKFIEANPGPSEDRPVRMALAEIYEKTYKLIGNIAVGYELNRVFISRWISLFLEHSNNINKPFIQECLLGILQNNPVSILATIDEDKIKSLINNFFNEARENKDGQLTTKYLRLFSTIIRCEDRVIKQNQTIILDNFFKNPQNEFNFKFKVEYKNSAEDDNDPFKVKSKEVLISFNHGKYVSLPAFYENKDTRKKWDYFLAYVNLLADICMDRNNQAIENVSNILPLQNVAVILFDPEVMKLQTQKQRENKEEQAQSTPTTNIHEPFVRIAHHVYVDNQKFQPIKRIKKISRWFRNEEGENSGVEDISRTKRVFEGEKEEEEERYLQSILEFIKNYLKSCDQKPQHLSMLLIVLNLLKATVILGLWKTIKSFREIVPLLVDKIAKIEEKSLFGDKPANEIFSETVEMNKQKLSQNRPEIASAIQCKIKATEIYSYMNELELDIRLRYLMNFFKGIYETTEDFNIYDTPARQLSITLPDQDLDEEARQKLERQLEQIKKRNQRAKEEYTKNDEKQVLGQDIQKVTEDTDIMLKQTIWYNKLIEMTPFKYVETSDPMKDRYFFQGEIEKKEDDEGQQLEVKYETNFNKILLALFELPIYKDYRLLNSSLTMLRAMFEQRHDLLENFKKILICGKGNLQEVYLTLKFMRAKFSMLTNLNIVKYEGDSDKAFSFDIWKPYDYLVKDREKRSGIIQDLFFLARTLKDETSLRNIESLMDVNLQVFSPHQVYAFYTEKQKNNQLFQALNIAEGIYMPLIQYIKIINQQPEIPEIHRKLLIAIYQYLTILCFDNLEAKQIFMQYIPDILPHLGKKVGADSFLYIVTKSNKLLVENEELVTQIIDAALQSCVSLSTSTAFTVFAQQMIDHQFNQSNDYERSRILFCLRGIILFNEEGHKRNQEILMNKLQNNSNKILIHREPLELTDKPPKLNDFGLTPPQAYIAYHFQLLSILVESSNLINIGKLSNIHKYQDCLTSLQNTNRWEIRRCLRAYINRLYYVNNDKDIFLFEEFIRRQFDIMNKELGDLVELHKSRLLTADLKIKNGIRFTYAQSQIYLFIIEILITLHEMFLKPDFTDLLHAQIKKEEKITDGKRPLHERLIQLFKYLGCLNNLYPSMQQTKTITSFINEIKRLLTIELEKMQLRFLEKMSSPEDEGKGAAQQEEEKNAEDLSKKNSYTYDHSRSFFRNLHQMIKFLAAKEKLVELKKQYNSSKNQVNVPESKMKEKYLAMIFSVKNEKLKEMYVIKKKPQQVHYNPHLQTSNSRIFKVLSKPDYEENEQNIRLNLRLNAVKKLIEESPVFSKFKDDEFINLVTKFTQLDQTSQDFYSDQWLENTSENKSRPVISFKQFFQHTFKMIMEHPKQIADSEKIFVIKLARCYITEAVEQKQDYKLLVDKWDPNYTSGSEQCAKKLEERQTNIEQCGGSDFLISIFSENLTSRVDLLNEALLLGIAYLYGGQKDCQNSILSSLRKDPDNVMLISMKNMIKYIGDFLINIRKFKQHEKKREYNHSLPDTFDYFSNEFMITRYFGQRKADKYEIMIENENEKALCRIFRFLQLFCENNNKEMKKFLKMQINEDEQKKTNSINFIEEACGLLKKLFKVMNIKLVSIPNNLLAFIVEITQVPILDNQLSFINSTFFEDLSYLASFFESEENRKNRKFNIVAYSDDDPLNELQNIYTQGIQLALSNFQGNDNKLISEFLKKCQPRFLWLVIRTNLWKMIKDRYTTWDFFVDDANDQVSMIETFKNLDRATIQEIIKQEKKKKYTGEEQNDSDYLFKDEITGIINVFVIKKKIMEFAEAKKALANKDPENVDLVEGKQSDKAFGFIQAISEEAKQFGARIEGFNQEFEKLIFQIEVQCDNGKEVKRQNIYFPRHPLFDYLSSETKQKVLFDVTRDTQRDKLTSLLEMREDIYSELKEFYSLDYYQFNIGSMHYEFPINSNLAKNTKKYANYLSYIICIFLAYTIYIDHEVDSDEPGSYFVFRKLFPQLIARLLCLTQLIMTLFYCWVWYKLRGNLALKKYLFKKKKEREEQASEENKQEEQNQEENAESQPEGRFAFLTKIYGAIMSVFSILFSTIFNFFLESWLYKAVIEKFIAVWNQEPETKSLLLFLTGAILGNFYGYEWYTIHIFDYFLNIPMLANVFKAVVVSIDVLGLLSALAIAFTVVFNLLSLSTYVPVLYEEQMPEESCKTVLDCVLTFYTAGPVGGDMSEFQPKRFAFDTLYVVFMEMIFEGLVSGLMIDGYNSLRASDDQREADQTGKCYICAKEKSNIERDGEVFSKHVDRHRLWHYLYYIYCLKSKDETDYTGIEYIINDQIQPQETKWFPSEAESQEGTNIEELAENLLTKLEEIQQKSLEVVDKNSERLDEWMKMLKTKQALDVPAIENA